MTSNPSSAPSGQVSARVAVFALAGLAMLLAMALGLGVNFPWTAGEFLAVHTLLEAGSVVACLSIGVTAWFVVEARRPRADRVLALGFLLVAALDLLHLLSNAELPGLVSPNSPHKSILFWLLARATEVTALLVWCWPAPQPRHAPMRLLLAGYATIVLALAAVALWLPGAFPATFVPGLGLTPFKRSTEGVLITLMLVALAGQWRRMLPLPPGERDAEAPVRDALVLMVISETFFVLYSARVTDTANALGHVYKLAAHALLFRGMFLSRVRHPFARLAQAHEALAQRSAEYQRLLELAPAGIVVCDANGRIRLVNRALEAMFGHARERLVGQPVEALLPTELQAGHRHLRKAWMADPTRPAMAGRSGLRGRRADGSLVDVEVALGGGDSPEGWQLTAYVSDVSHRRMQDAALRHRATHDVLTGLPNRWQFAQELGLALERAAASGEPVAVAVLDLDAFKAVNDGLGSASGDKVLQAVAAALSGVLRRGDLLARLGSDEFAVLAQGVGLGQPLAALAQLLADALVPAAEEAGGAWTPSAGIGLAAFPADAVQADELLHCAELALGESKCQGRAVITAYEPALGQRVLQALRVQTRLRQALQDGVLSLHYQPQVDVASGGVIGFEALLRWNDPDLGAVPPAEFVPLAERSGLIGELGDFVLRTACAQLRRWLDAGLPTRIAVNLSPRQFRHAGLAERIAQELQAQRLPGALLAVEITETAVMDDPAAAAVQLRALQTLGVEVHLDDFGTGHSSLAWLKNLPISVIKVDRSFLREILHDRDDEAIVGAIVGLAHALDCRVVAEGVEQTEQLELLGALGCDQYQGWLFSKALDAADASDLLRRKGHVADSLAPMLATVA